MKIDKVIMELRERMEDPFQKDLARKIIMRLEEIKQKKNPILGRMLVDLLTKAENGDFK